MFLNLDIIKAQIRLDDYIIEDDLLALYGDAAEETIAGVLNRGDTVEEMVASLVGQYGKIPAAIVQAGLMLVDLSYQQRSPVSVQNLYAVGYAFDIKVKPYMRLR